MEEVWKDVKDWEGLYQVSNLGRVRSLDKKVNCKYGKTKIHRGKIRTLSISKRYGYVRVSLWDKGKRLNCSVHRLVAEVFCENPDSKEWVNHKDGNKQNNVSTNLEWVTGSENIKHAMETGLMTNFKRGHEHTSSKLTKEQVLSIRELRSSTNMSYGKIGSLYGVTGSTVRRVCLRQTYANV